MVFDTGRRAKRLTDVWTCGKLDRILVWAAFACAGAPRNENGESERSLIPSNGWRHALGSTPKLLRSTRLPLDGGRVSC